MIFLSVYMSIRIHRQYGNNILYWKFHILFYIIWDFSTWKLFCKILLISLHFPVFKWKSLINFLKKKFVRVNFITFFLLYVRRRCTNYVTTLTHSFFFFFSCHYIVLSVYLKFPRFFTDRTIIFFLERLFQVFFILFDISSEFDLRKQSYLEVKYISICCTAPYITRGAFNKFLRKYFLAKRPIRLFLLNLVSVRIFISKCYCTASKYC